MTDCVLDRGRPINMVATPMILLPGQTEEERLIAAEQMFERAMAARALLDGVINWDDYLMLMDDHEIDCIDFHDNVSNGLVLL